MRRFYILAFVLTLLLPCNGRGQTYNTFDNTFLSFGAGPNFYVSSGGSNFGFGAAMSFGKWIVNTSGLRIQYALQYAHGMNEPQLYQYGHFDILFDILTSFKGRNPSNVFRSYVGLGVGLAHSSGGDNDFCGTMSLGCEWRTGKNWRLFGELETVIHPSNFDDNSRSSLLNMLSVGVVRDINSNPTRSRSRYETQGLYYDWFFQFAVGVNSFNYKGIGSFSDRLSMLTPSIEFGFGKRLTTRWQIRLCASGLYAQSEDELYTYYNLRGDLMLDVAGLLNPDKPHSLLTARPYMSAGILSRFDDQSHFLFSPAAGFQFVVRPNTNNEIYLDARYSVTPPRFAHVDHPQSTISVGMAAVTLGYSYTFRKNSFK